MFQFEKPFRALIVGHKRWVYGGVYFSPEERYAKIQTRGTSVRVDPNTICMSTEIAAWVDENNERYVYAGDIIQFEKDGKLSRLHVVEWDQGAFWVVDYKNGKPVSCDLFFSVMRRYDCIYIRGDVYHHKDLLEVRDG